MLWYSAQLQACWDQVTRYFCMYLASDTIWRLVKAWFCAASAVFCPSGFCCHTLQVWDRRALGRGAKPAGVLVGHSEGLTHLDSKGDGRYLLSNSKDQTARLWDVRKVRASFVHEPTASAVQVI